MLKLNIENIEEFQDGLQVSDVSSCGWQCRSPNKGIEEKDHWGKDNKLRAEYAQGETPSKGKKKDADVPAGAQKTGLKRSYTWYRRLLSSLCSVSESPSCMGTT